MKGFLRSTRGITMVEVLVAVGVLTTVMTSFGTVLFQSLRTQTSVADDGLAANEEWKGLNWLGNDIKMAQAMSLVDGGPPATSLTLTWTDQFGGAGTPHSASYALVGDRLVRTYDGNAHTVAHRVASVSFSRSLKTVTSQIEVRVTPSSTRTRSVKTTARAMP